MEIYPIKSYGSDSFSRPSLGNRAGNLFTSLLLKSCYLLVIATKLKGKKKKKKEKKRKCNIPILICFILKLLTVKNEGVFNLRIT